MILSYPHKKFTENNSFPFQFRNIVQVHLNGYFQCYALDWTLLLDLCHLLLSSLFHSLILLSFCT